MNKDMQIKNHVLEMLKSLMMDNSGSKFKPVSMEVVMAKPKEGESEKGEKEGLEEVLDKAKADNPVSEEEKDEMMDEEGIPHEDVVNDHDEDNEEEDMKDMVKGLRAFMARK